MDKISTGNWFTIYFVKLHLTQKFAFSSISSLLMYYILINVLYLNFCIISQVKCSICKLFDETPQHLFYERIYTQHLWNHLQLYISGKITLPASTPQSAIFGFTDVLDQNYLLVNHFLLIFQYSVHNSKINNTFSFQILKCAISPIKYIEQTISENVLNEKRKFLNKWKLIDNLF